MAPTENIDLDSSYEPAPKSPREEPLFCSRVYDNKTVLTPELLQQAMDACNRPYLGGPKVMHPCSACGHLAHPGDICIVVEECDCGHPSGLDMCGCRGVDLYCSTCSVILVPHEITLDLGDGPELLCDKCLGLTN